MLSACDAASVDVVVRRDTQVELETEEPSEVTPPAPTAPAIPSTVAPSTAPPDDEPVEVPPETDVVDERDAGVQLLDAGSSPDLDAAPCAVGDVVVANRYRFLSRLDGRCMDTGQAVNFGGVPTWYAGLSTVCDDGESLWQLVQSSTGAFELRHAIWNYNLDIERGSTSIGANALLYPPSTLLNQRFRFWERDEGYIAITAEHAKGRCLRVTSTGRVQLADCELGVAAQEWRIEPEDCPTRALSAP